MKLKQRVADFRVRELLADDYLRSAGDHRVYRVTKKKLTTLEALAAVAEAAGCETGAVGLAGMKDRQGVTVQHMSVPRGPELSIAAPELKVETAGFAEEPLSSGASRGNAFELVVRALGKEDLAALRANLPLVRAHGLPNYFDDQRFGNVTHEQGWIAKDLMLGRHEAALRRLLTATSPFDPPREERFKRDLDEAWGDPRACRELAGKHGAHHSIFEHLQKHPDDHAGAFTYVASRLRLIHLYAFQSHVWNRAVAALVRELVEVGERVVLPGVEGPLVAWAGPAPEGLDPAATFRLPGEGLEDVSDERQARLLRDELAEHRMVADQFRIEGVSGFHVKGEDRPLVIVPEHLRVRPAEADVLNRGQRAVRLRFELPRGAYATLVVKRLFAREAGEPSTGGERPPRAGRGNRREARPGAGHGGHGRRGSWYGRGERDVGFRKREPWESDPRAEQRGRAGGRDEGARRGRGGEDERRWRGRGERDEHRWRGSEGRGERGERGRDDRRGPGTFGGPPRREHGERREHGWRDRGERREYGWRDRGEPREHGSRDRGSSREHGWRDRGEPREHGSRDRGEHREHGSRERGASREHGWRDRGEPREHGSRDRGASREHGWRDRGEPRQHGWRDRDDRERGGGGGDRRGGGPWRGDREGRRGEPRADRRPGPGDERGGRGGGRRDERGGGADGGRRGGDHGRGGRGEVGNWGGRDRGGRPGGWQDRGRAGARGDDGGRAGGGWDRRDRGIWRGDEGRRGGHRGEDRPPRSGERGGGPWRGQRDERRPSPEGDGGERP